MEAETRTEAIDVWDWILLASTISLTPAAMLTLADKAAYVPRRTSGLFTVAIAIIALSLYMSELPLGAFANAIGSVTWGVIFTLRGKPQI